MYERSFAGFVVFSGTGKGKIRETGVLRVDAVEQVIDPRRLSIGQITRDVHHFLIIVHFGDPSVEAYLYGSDGYTIEVVDIVKHGVFAEGFGQSAFDAGHIESGDDSVELLVLVLNTDFKSLDTGGNTVLVDQKLFYPSLIFRT